MRDPSVEWRQSSDGDWEYHAADGTWHPEETLSKETPDVADEDGVSPINRRRQTEDGRWQFLADDGYWYFEHEDSDVGARDPREIRSGEPMNVPSPPAPPPQPGWWMASDGTWYPPQMHPGLQATNARRVASSANERVAGGAWLAIFAGTIIIIGAFMPWITLAGEFSRLTRNAFAFHLLSTQSGLTYQGPVLLLLGGFTALIGIARLFDAQMPRFLQRSPILTGLLSALIALTGIHYLRQRFNGHLTASIGYGVWVVVVGAVVAIGSGLVLRRAIADATSSEGTGPVSTNLPPPPSAPPPGWYADSCGVQRWWEGTQWGPIARPPPPTAGSPGNL